MNNFQDVLISGLNQIQSDGELRGAFRHILNSGVINSGNKIYPNIDIVEKKEEILIYVEMAGVDQSTIDINFYNNKIRISAERKKKYNIRPKMREICYGEFNREFIIPISVTNDKNVSVKYDDGIILIIINKKEEESNGFNVTL